MVFEREEIRFMIERDGSAKGIVFSQFKSFLDLMNYSLDKSGINCLKLVGSMTMSTRDDAMRKFTVDPNYKIILMSLKAGGVALNLTVASHREEIRFMIEKDGSAKGIVFSQFKSFLDLMNYSLDKSGINCLTLVGSARDDAIRSFTVDPNYKIILMSLKAGGVALNLTVASHILGWSSGIILDLRKGYVPFCSFLGFFSFFFGTYGRDWRYLLPKGLGF
ncbi:hypothetical protein HHK36_023111 [Tetracentron sinense]|uniref:Helicase C-terminal domain-containing protein n=1 Tax=Tetracentron sinense TaxID=13715 RepID=A0A835D7L9_TETSI|nr:hypothetical protein HHK36_023111 [Tetracentron sinense]